MSTVTLKNKRTAINRLARYNRNRSRKSAKQFQTVVEQATRRPNKASRVQFRVGPNNIISNQNNNQNDSNAKICVVPILIGVVGFYILVCSALYVTGAIDIQSGAGLQLLAFNLVVMCICIALVFAFPWKVGCDKQD
jgi:Ca2+/Na+ antiporter